MIKNNQLTLRLDTLLLLVLVTAHMWFNPVSNALMVIGLAAYVALDLIYPDDNDELATIDNRYRLLFLVRLAIIFFIVLIAAVLPTHLNIIERLNQGPATHAHDGLIQTEIAIEYLLDSFPIKGWGFSTLILSAGIIPTPESAFPFAIFQMVFALPVLFLTLRRQWRDNNLQNMWFGFAAFLFVFQFFSRFFNDNYFVMVLQLLVISVFIRPVHYR